MTPALVLVALLLACGTAKTGGPEKAKVIEFPATVSRVIDGDTVTISKPDGKTDTIRFALIDTPEPGQPFAAKAKKFVEAACLMKKVTIRTTGERDTTSSKRLIAEIILADGTNLNRELVRRGLAWWFYHYSRDASVGKFEAEAKAARRGIFSSETPIYPRNWRRGARVTRVSAAKPSVFILAVLPNPEGSDNGHETVTLANRTSKPVNIEKWRLIDDDGGSMALSGTVAAGSARTITLTRGLLLGNRGDVVTLLDAKGRPVHAVQYENAPSGQFVLVGK